MHFNQRLLDVDDRDLDYLFVAQYIVEAKQVLDDGNNFAMRQKPCRQFTAAQAKDQAILSQYVNWQMGIRLYVLWVFVSSNDNPFTRIVNSKNPSKKIFSNPIQQI